MALIEMDRSGGVRTHLDIARRYDSWDQVDPRQSLTPALQVSETLHPKAAFLNGHLKSMSVDEDVNFSTEREGLPEGPG